jgi:hypothetical protein
VLEFSNDQQRRGEQWNNGFFDSFKAMAELGKCSRENETLFAFVGTSRCASHEDGEEIGRMVSSQFARLVIARPSTSISSSSHGQCRAVQDHVHINHETYSDFVRTEGRRV